MNKKVLMSFGITILFLVIAFQPATIAKISIKSDVSNLVEITIQICGEEEIENHTFMITQQQQDELNYLIENFKSNLDETETIEEAIPHYRNMVDSLCDLDILPEKLDFEYSEKNINNIKKRSFSDNPNLQSFSFDIKNEKLVDVEPLLQNCNIFCLISGETTRTFVLPPSTMYANGLIFSYLYLLELLLEKTNLLDEDDYYKYLGFIEVLAIYIFARVLFSVEIPLTLGSGISFGIYGWDEWGYKFYVPAQGWINTHGLLGNKKWEDTFYGQIKEYFLLLAFLYIGVVGFTGIKIYIDGLENTFFLGFARYINIDYQKPKSIKNVQDINNIIKNLFTNDFFGLTEMKY